jgi:hypothetical protein
VVINLGISWTGRTSELVDITNLGQVYNIWRIWHGNRLMLKRCVIRIKRHSQAACILIWLLIDFGTSTGH